MFSTLDGGRGEAIGGGTGIGSGVAGAEDTVPRDQTSILRVWNSREYLGRQGLLEDQGSQLQKWEDCDDWHNGTINLAYD